MAHLVAALVALPCLLPTPARDGYLVATVGLDALPAEEAGAYRAVAFRAAAHHGARAVESGPDLEALLAALRGEPCEELLVVVPPTVLDAALHRRLLAAATALDDDPFVDVAIGYLTASSPERLAALWERTERVHAEGLRSRRWMEGFVTSGMASTVYAGRIPEMARRLGFEGSGLAFACVESDPAVLQFAAEHLPDLDGCGVLSFTGNGDPQGIWLFDGRRNLDRSKHWPYAPDLVGQDPDGAMPRLLARELARRDLAGAVVWSGTCHSAVPLRAFVEGDIVSTFGRVDGPTLHLLEPDQSLCLALLDAGAVALLAPIGPNHGMAVDREQEFVLRHGATLGEAVKSTWDDVVLSQGALPRLEVPGRRNEFHEPIMAGGGVNRVLLGDPALRPFAAAEHPSERIAVSGPTDGTLQVDVEWDAGFHPAGWDMYGSDRERDWRVVARVELDPELVAPGARPRVEVSASSLAGDPAPHAAPRALVERHAGRVFLHLVANAPRDGVAYEGVRARFTVRLDGGTGPQER